MRKPIKTFSDLALVSLIAIGSSLAVGFFFVLCLMAWGLLSFLI